MLTKRYVQDLTKEDRIHVSFTKNRGKILEFSINYSALIKRRWRVIFRVDNCHGYPHEHRYYLRRKQYRVGLKNTNEGAFTYANKYIRGNFLKIKENYLRARDQNPL